ncbi:unnamed protein product [Adineta ricciae]|uniref:G-protein coupled receptors family 1 profile domain-containing protein n=1 Tax=Adineta ricciae TaxID=249248 RepID=A0A815QQP7_ADIRI|nr:unnamed protein product [Adineta ricciae]
MANNSNSSFVADLSSQITLYSPIIIIIMGNIGCILNFMTFTSRKLIRTSYSLYCLSSTVFDLLTLDFGALTRLLIDHFGYNIQNYSQVYCKIRFYLINTFPTSSTCFIVLAAMDRYLSTSSKLKYRSFATRKRAICLILISLFICILFYAHYLVFADLRPTCSIQPGIYSLFTVIYSLVVTSFIPHFLMLYFGFGTLYHIRTARHRTVAVFNTQQNRRQRTEIQLVTMTLFQVTISTILIGARMAYYSYNVITANAVKTSDQKTLDTFFSELTTQLFYLNYAKSFYIYTLSSRVFRRILIVRVTQLSQRCFCQQSRHHVTRT